MFQTFFHSIVRCLNYCKVYGYLYAGIEDGWKCSCGNEKPAQSQLAALQSPCPLGTCKCSTPCKGDPNMVCGGRNLINVYSLSYSGQGVGCKVTIASEKSFSVEFPASSALRDNTFDECCIKFGDGVWNFPAIKNFWTGHYGKSWFIIDLGCESTVREIQLRNGNNANGNNGYVFDFNYNSAT